MIGDKQDTVNMIRFPLLSTFFANIGLVFLRSKQGFMPPFVGRPQVYASSKYWLQIIGN